MKDVVVGQPIILVRRAERNRQGSHDEKFSNFHVVKVGRKYFYARDDDSRYSREMRFRRDDWVESSDFPRYQAFRDEDHYRNEIERERKIGEANKYRHDYSTRFERLGSEELDQLIALLKKAGKP